MSDPFDCFESDSEGEDNEERNPESAEIANSLMRRANGLDQPLRSTNSRISQTQSIRRDTVNISVSDLPVELPWPNPLFLNGLATSVYNIPKFGGGRGFCALKNLDPGTIILIEEPVMEWAEDQVGKKLNLSTIQCLLEHPQSKLLVHWLESFHPLKITVDQGPVASNRSDEQLWQMIEEIKMECKDEQILDLVNLAERQGIVCRDSSPISDTDILRMLLCIRYNGLESGLYLYAAMLNHSCHPNCAKFLPQSGQTHSEVVTTRAIESGEILSISYCPNIMSHASRRRYLYHHHRFDISEDINDPFRAMELVNGKIPPSSTKHVAEESPTRRVEKTLEEFQALHEELMGSILMDESRKEALMALELSILELAKESERQLGPNHLLLIRCFTLHLDVSDVVHQVTDLSNNTVVELLCRQVRSAHQLIKLQSRFHGLDHFDLARSHLDLANSISELLSRSPPHLNQLCLPDLGNFRQWSQKERESRNEHDRIKSLYSTKTEHNISGRKVS